MVDLLELITIKNMFFHYALALMNREYFLFVYVQMKKRKKKNILR